MAEGKFKDLEVWGLGPEPQSEKGIRQSVLDMDKEAQVLYYVLVVVDLFSAVSRAM